MTASRPPNEGQLSVSALFGDASEMSGSAQGGNDSLTANDDGVNSFSELRGDAYTMSGSAKGGNDVLNGGAGNDYLYGDAVVYNNLSFPGSITGGTDTLNGGAGDDQLWGGPNDDKFVFSLGSGNDTINDFDQGNAAVGSTATEHDQIDVQAYYANWDALSPHITYSGSDAFIDLGGTNQVTVLGITSLTPDDFFWTV
jgi:Ca2+-binding RTX toxin-like protein